MVETARSRILGPDGQPIDRSMLSGDTAAPQEWGQRALVAHSEATGLTPERLAGILRSANHGLARPYLTLAIDMEERYIHYAAQLQTRRLALDGVNIVVSAQKGIPSKITEAVQSLVDAPIFRDMCQDLMDGVSKSYSVVEPVWDYAQKYLRPIIYQHRDPRYFGPHRVKLNNLHLLDEAGMPGLELSRPYFIQHKPQIRTGQLIRGGLARSAAWSFMVQSFTLQDWSAFAEIYGVPLRVGKYHKSATQEDIRTLLRAVRAIANDAAAVIPKEMEVEFHSVSGNHGAQVFGELIAYLDRKISMLVIGQTMTAENGSSLGQAKVHNQVRHDILRADGRQLSTTINRDLVEPFVAMNFGPQDAYPQIRFEVAEPDDIKAFADAVSVGVTNGLEISQAFFRKKIGAPDPVEGEKLLKAPDNARPKRVPDMPAPSQSLASQSPGLHVRGCRCEACLGTAQLKAEPVEEPDPFDDVVEEQLSGWEKVVDPLLEELYATVAEAGSLEEALEKLDALRLDVGPLARKLGAATMIARGLGDISDE